MPSASRAERLQPDGHASRHVDAVCAGERGDAMRALRARKSPVRAPFAAMLAVGLAACASVAPAPSTQVPTSARPVATLPDEAPQGALVVGRAAPGSRVLLAGRALRVGPDGTFVFGVARDAVEPLSVVIEPADGAPQRIDVAVRPREWPEERVDGVPPQTVEPPPEIAARIREEQARVAAARERDDDRLDFLQPFVWPVEGRISGRFGHRRVYNGVPGAPHSGMDIAAAEGTPVRAPAAGLVTFADPGLYLTGGTVVLDHGFGVSSNFLHLSRIDVRVGQRVEQGQTLGAVGATGRATGPHLHWGMNWFEVRIDPLLVLERGAR